MVQASGELLAACRAAPILTNSLELVKDRKSEALRCKKEVLEPQSYVNCVSQNEQKGQGEGLSPGGQQVEGPMSLSLPQ